MVTRELVKYLCVRTCVRTQEGFLLFLLSPRHPSPSMFNVQSSIFNVSLDLRSLAKQECLMYIFFCCKDTTNGTVQSDFPFFSFDSFVSFDSLQQNDHLIMTFLPLKIYIPLVVGLDESLRPSSEYQASAL